MKRILLSLLILSILLVNIAVIPVATAKSNPDHITFVKLSDIEFIDKSGQGITMTKGWLKNLLKVEWGYGSYTNATLVWDGEKLTVYLQDDVKHDGRWFALNEQILQRVGIDPDKVSVKLDTQAPAEVVKRLKADGKWFYFFIDHFTTRYVTFEASEGYVELADWSYENHAKLIEPDPYCSDCAVFAPMEDLADNGDGTGNTTIYVNGEAQIVTVYFNESTGYPKLVQGKKGSALEFDGNNSEYVKILHSDIIAFNDTARESRSIVLWVKVTSLKDSMYLYSKSRNYYAYYQAGNFIFRIYDGSKVGQVLVPSTAIVDGEYHLIVHIIDRQEQRMKVYVDGVLYDETDISTIGETYTSSNLYIGSDGTIAHSFKGIIDEFGIYRKVLTEKEIQALLLGRYRLALWQGNEASLPGYLNATLFCPLDSLDTVNNVTPCYLNKSLINATVTFNSQGYPKLTSGFVKNGVEFDGSGLEYVKYTFDSSQTWDKLIISFYADPNSTDLMMWNALYGGGFAVMIKSGTSWFATLSFTDSTNTDFIGTTNDLQPHVHTILIDYDSTTNTTIVEWYVDGEKVKEQSYNKEIKRTFNVVMISPDWGSQVIDGVIDEFMLYINKTLTDEEIKLLAHLSRHKFATLSAPSATFDGSQFLVNVTAQLPGDGKSYVLPAPLGAQGLTSVGTIGNFTFLNAGTAGEVSYTLPVAEDLSCPAGINLLAWLYDNEIYMTGAEDEFPIMATIMHLPKGVWYTTHGEIVYQQITTTQTTLVIANVTSPASLVKRYSNFFAEPKNNYVNLTVLQYSQDYIKFNASALADETVTFTFTNLKKDWHYDVYIDGQKVATYKTAGTTLAISVVEWSSHIIELKALSPLAHYKLEAQGIKDVGSAAIIMLAVAVLVQAGAIIIMILRQGEGDLKTIVQTIVAAVAVLVGFGVLWLMLTFG